ncbi:MAG: hypothetical protein A2W11_13640 [Ignavibacteria bacterium RBG_16_35_7]|nr:MAG: hypothetical protein A2W11_13640 [Ignavibacteria bacterium RBG_16_35_7]
MKGQTISIPGANQQPLWAFAFYISDSTGNTDTLYYGYDPNSIIWTGNPGADSIFGEKLVLRDTINFAASCYDGFTMPDSISRVDIRSSFLFYFEMQCWNARLPIKLKWDASLLHSDSIPYPNQGLLPTGQIDFNWCAGNSSLGANYPGCGCGAPIIITDTASFQCNTSQTDSLMIYDLFNDTTLQTLNFGFYFNPWSGTWLGIPSHKSDNVFAVFPIPSSSFIEVQSGEPIISARLCSISGIVYWQSDSNINKKELSIDVEKFPEGVYFLSLENKNIRKSYKVLIIH